MTEPAGTTRASLAPMWLAVFAVFVLACLYHWPHALDHDVASFLAEAHMANRGARLYTDIIEINTPITIWIGQLSDGIARAIHAPLAQTHMAVLLATTLLGTTLSLAVLTPLLVRPGPARWCLALGVPAALMFAAVEIGSREHLGCLGLLPWALTIALADRFAPRPALGAVVGLVAGLALFVKPHFALFGLALGLIDLVRARGRPHRLKLATWIAAAVSIALYAGLLLTPGYASEMTPLVLETMGRYKTPLLASIWVFAKSGKLPLLILALGSLYLLLRSKPGGRFPLLPASVGAAFVIISAIIYVQQGFDYGYQLVPMKTALNLCAIFTLAWLLSRDKTFAPLLGARITWAVLALLTISLAGWWAPALIKKVPTNAAMAREPLYAALKPPHPGEAVLVLSPSVDPTSNYLTLMDAEWSGPMIGFVPAPALVSQNGRTAINHPPAPDVRQHWADWLREKAAASLAASPPVRVAVEISEKPIFFENSGFDLLSWFCENADFNAAWRKANLQKTGEPVHWRWRTYQIYAPAR